MVEKQEIVSGIAEAVKTAERKEHGKKRFVLPIAIVIILILAVAFLLLQQGPILPPLFASCENGALDASEEGIDCGGSCFAQCLSDLEKGDETFTAPFSVADVAVGPNDRIYVVDNTRNRLMIYSKELKFLRNIGEKDFVSGGAGDYQFDLPFAVAVAADGKVFVSERFPENVKVFDASAKFLETIVPDTEGYGRLIDLAVASDGRIAVIEQNKKAVFIISQDKQVQQLNEGVGDPASVAFAGDGRLFVSDNAEHKVKVFSKELQPIGAIGEGKGNTNNSFNFPSGIAFAPNGNLVVADSENKRVQVFSADGKFTATVGLGKLMRPVSVAVDSAGRIIVADAGSNKIVVFNSDYSFAAEIEGSSFSALAYSEFKPRYLAVAPDGKIFVGEEQNSRVIVLDKQFKFAGKLGTGTGFGDYEFNNPRYLAVDTSGRLFVADIGNNRVQIFDKELHYLATIGSGKGDGSNELNTPQGIAFDSAGRIFVVDGGNKRVQVFDKDFKYLASITAPAGQNFNDIALVAVDKEDNIYLGKYSDAPDASVFFVFSKDLQYVKTIDLTGKFSEITGIDVDAAGRIVFTAGENRKLALIDSATGNVIKSVGKEGTGNGEFSWISDVKFLPDGKILVVDLENKRLQLFDSGLNFIRVIDGGVDGLIETSG
jgi:DNA-binding beta-propeller fold protein YncE